jgi:hypothetical protein
VRESEAVVVIVVDGFRNIDVRVFYEAAEVHLVDEITVERRNHNLRVHPRHLENTACRVYLLAENTRLLCVRIYVAHVDVRICIYKVAVETDTLAKYVGTEQRP